MPLDPNIIMSGPRGGGVDVNALYQQQMQGMENINKMERLRQADALDMQDRAAAQAKEQQAAIAQMMLPAVAAAFSDPSDAGLAAAASLMPPEAAETFAPFMDRLRSVPDPKLRQSLLRAEMMKDDEGRLIMAQLEPTANMRLQADTAAQRAALDQRRMAFEEQKFAAETASGERVSPDKAAELAFRREELAVRKAEQEAKAAAEGKGKVDPVAATKADDTLGKIMAAYQKLKELQAITSTGQTAGQNLAATISAKTGSTVGAAVGSEAQTQRQIIKNLRQALLNDIKAATGMSSKAIDSNVELQSFLNSLGDPESQSYEAAIATIGELSAKYASGALSGAAQDILKGKTNAQTTAQTTVPSASEDPELDDLLNKYLPK